jgi:hypothetical protein
MLDSGQCSGFHHRARPDWSVTLHRGLRRRSLRLGAKVKQCKVHLTINDLSTVFEDSDALALLGIRQAMRLHRTGAEPLPDDEDIVPAVQYLNWLAAPDPKSASQHDAAAGAFRLAFGAWPNRLFLEASVLSLKDADWIAEQLGCTKEQVRTYERLFLDYDYWWNHRDRIAERIEEIEPDLFRRKVLVLACNEDTSLINPYLKALKALFTL